jgi:hypothetical protein
MSKKPLEGLLSQIVPAKELSKEEFDAILASVREAAKKEEAAKEDE